MRPSPQIVKSTEVSELKSLPSMCAESAVHVKHTELDVQRHREKKPQHFFERVPVERTELYSTWRQECTDRTQNLLHKRFPALEQSKASFMGTEPGRSQNKKLHSNEIVQYSKAVLEESQKVDPHFAR